MTYVKPFQVMPIGAGILSNVRIEFERPRVWERKDVLLYVHVVGLVYFEAS